jgi:hypothetical protein
MQAQGFTAVQHKFAPRGAFQGGVFGDAVSDVLAKLQLELRRMPTVWTS